MTTSIYQQMLATIRASYPNYADVWEGTRNEFGAAWEEEFNTSVAALFGRNPESWNEAIDGYAEFCTDALRAQIYFERKGEYKASSYAAIAEQCYHNPDFMLRCYPLECFCRTSSGPITIACFAILESRWQI